jgi:hypothetical protein
MRTILLPVGGMLLATCLNASCLGTAVRTGDIRLAFAATRVMELLGCTQNLRAAPERYPACASVCITYSIHFACEVI